MVVGRYVTDVQGRRSDGGPRTLCERIRPRLPGGVAPPLCQVLINFPAHYPTVPLGITWGPAISEQPSFLNQYNSAAVREC